MKVEDTICDDEEESSLTPPSPRSGSTPDLLGTFDEDEEQDGDPDEDEDDGDDAVPELGADLAAAFGVGEAQGLETRRQKQMIAAALFDEPITPVRIGRFTIVRELGAGGMGVVYVAYDEQLDRKVAVKLLKGEASEIARMRLEREAQAMAKLTHPHVVTVHDVGTFEGQVFVAMEFVEGRDLRGWLAAEGRDWRAIVDVFVQAGEGIAAAHAAGIVHRDFKPDNVLVGDDGRVRVADFGLAHAFDASRVGPKPEPDPEPEPEPETASASTSGVEDTQLHDSAPTSSSQSGNRLDDALTRTGALMGTPAYMAPEQYGGARTDARSDQFSFCVALWEGLYGVRPFRGETLAALSLAIMSGKIASVPETGEVPPWLGEVLARGMSTDPEARWPSMRELLDVLRRDPIARRRRLLLGLSLGGLALVLVGGLSWLAAVEIARNARQHYWSALTEQLLGIERDRGLRQANDDAQRARDATRMSMYRRYQPAGGIADVEDPTVAAVLLREVEGEGRFGSAWVSAANETLGRQISHAILSGHRGEISWLSFSPDGEWLYSASFDGEVRRWRRATGEGRVIIEHDGFVTDLAPSPNGQLLASSSHDGTVRLWSIARPDHSRVLTTHAGPVMGVAFGPDSRWVASASKDGTAQLHDLHTGRRLILEGHTDAVHDVAFDAAGEQLLTTSSDHGARLWRVEDGALLASFGGHAAPVFHGRILADGRVLTGADDGTVRLHDRRSAGIEGEAIGRVIARHPSAITALDVHATKVISAAVDGSMIVSSIAAGSEPLRLPGHSQGVWAVRFTPDGEDVASASFDGTARLTRADGRGVPRVYAGHRLSVLRLAIDDSGRWLATGSYDTTVRLWDLEREPLEVALEGHKDKLVAIAVDRDGARVATASHDGSVRLWDSRDGSELAVLAGTDSVNQVEFSPDGEQIGVARSRGALELWTPATDARRSFEGHDRNVWELDFDATGARLASAASDNTARIWDTRGRAEPVVIRGHEDRVTCVDFEPNGARLVTASHDATVRVWDTTTGAELRVLRGHEGKIASMVRSPNGRLVATGSDDGTARLWTTDGSAEPIVLPGHQKQVWSLAFDPSGERLVTASFDGLARVWSVADGRLLETLSGHADQVWGASFAPGDRVVTVSNDATVRVWSLGDDRVPIVLSGRGAGLTSLAMLPGGERLVSASIDGTAQLWRLDQLSADPDGLLERLWAVTIYCLPVDERIRDLGEDRPEAELALAACEQR